MRRTGFFAVFLTICVAVSLCLTPFSVSAYTLDKETSKGVTARASIVMYLDSAASAETGVAGRDILLYANNENTPYSPAVMMRIMVGLYAEKLIAEKNLDTKKTTGTYTEALQDGYVWGTGLTVANMEIGEVWTIQDLLSVSMIQTAADAAVTLAATLGGTVEAFVQGMNEYAKQLGCKNTSFANVTGIDNIQQKTTPYDTYIMLRYALDIPELTAMLGAQEYTVTPVSGGYERSWENSNYMLRPSDVDYYYDPLQLGKTGWSEDSGKNLASVAQLDGYRYLVVVMGCPDEDSEGDGGTHYTSSKALYNWVFNKFEYVNMIAENQPMTRQDIRLAWSTDSVTLVAQNSLSCLVPEGLDTNTVRTEITLNTEDLKAPVKKGEVLGKATLYIRENEKIGEVNLVADEGVKRSNFLFVMDAIRSVIRSPWVWGTLLILLIFGVSYLIMAIQYNKKKRRIAKESGYKKYKSLK